MAGIAACAGHQQVIDRARRKSGDRSAIVFFMATIARQRAGWDVPGRQAFGRCPVMARGACASRNGAVIDRTRCAEECGVVAGVACGVARIARGGGYHVPCRFAQCRRAVVAGCARSGSWRVGRMRIAGTEECGVVRRIAGGVARVARGRSCDMNRGFAGGCHAVMATCASARYRWVWRMCVARAKEGCVVTGVGGGVARVALCGG